MGKLQLLHFTRECISIIKVRWLKLQSLTSTRFMILPAKDYQNQPMFHGVIPKIKVAWFLRHVVDMNIHLHENDMI